ncbi:MAG: RING finger domain-containing protein [Candidatus Lokiarchaeota archaeon]
MPKCIICHLDIEASEEYLKCPNDHPSHSVCLKEWFKHSKKCPLCRESYDANIINKFQSYLEEEEAKIEEELKKQQQEQTMNEIKEIGMKMVFLKFFRKIEKLELSKDYDRALKKLETQNADLNTENGRQIIFLKGKINYLKGRYDLAINHLFKLVKEKFDFPQAFFYLGKSYEELGLEEKAKWAYDRVPKSENSQT